MPSPLARLRKASATVEGLRQLVVFGVIAALLLAALHIGGYVLMRQIIREERSSAAQINVSGRLRMLTMTIANQSDNILLFPGERQDHREALAHTIDLVARSYRGLVHGDPDLGLPGKPSAAVQAILREPPYPLDRRLKDFLATAKAFLMLGDAELAGRTKDAGAMHAAANELMPALDALTLQYQRESEANVAALRQRAQILLAAKLALLAVMALLLFWPLLRRLRQQVGALVLAEKFQRSVANSLVEGLIVIDEQGIVQDYNPAAERMFGYTAGEVVGRNVRMLMPEPHASRHDGYIQRYLQTGEPHVIGIGREVEGRRKDGSTFPVELAVNKVDCGGRVCFVGIMHDISERKAAEREIMAKNRELEQANRIKSEFLASMSHELRTPLNTVIGFSEALKDGVLGHLEDEQREYIADIHKSGRHLLALINDVLDLSKIEAGMMELQLQPVAVDGLLHDCLTMLRERALRQGVTLEDDVEEQMGALLLDERRAKQIVLNLLSNAVKFTPEGGSVRLSARKVRGEALLAACRGGLAHLSDAISPDDDFLEICVADTGIGIAEEDQAKLFQPFTQIDSKLSRTYEGTGLGLDIVKRLCELHGGGVGVESELGRGSRFYAWLPYRPQEAAAGAPPPASAGTSATASQPLMVLLVEDEDRAAELLRMQLAGAGHHTHRAASAEAALAWLKDHTPDVITLDLILPGMDGWDFLAQLKRHERLAAIPVVIVSIVADAKKGFALGAAKVLQKPVERDELLQALAILPPGRNGQPVVLAVDDDANALRLISRRLKDAPYRLITAGSGAEAIALARNEQPDVMLLDLMMPGMSGFDRDSLLGEIQRAAGLKGRSLDDHPRC